MCKKNGSVIVLIEVVDDRWCSSQARSIDLDLELQPLKIAQQILYYILYVSLYEYVIYPYISSEKTTLVQEFHLFSLGSWLPSAIRFCWAIPMGSPSFSLDEKTPPL